MAPALDTNECDCRSGRYCTGPHGGHFCMIDSGAKSYLRNSLVERSSAPSRGKAWREIQHKCDAAKATSAVRRRWLDACLLQAGRILTEIAAARYPELLQPSPRSCALPRPSLRD